ncbi:MAG: hypothetical protein KGO02_09060 [Alphaproteobacteria bacterium]|nr:hypothetical protein [Alphaproteobacteria bacterium]
MAAFKLVLKFNKNSLCRDGAAFLVVQNHTTDDDGDILLTPEAASPEEFEGYLKMIQADLDKVAKEARKKFAEMRKGGQRPLGLKTI